MSLQSSFVGEADVEPWDIHKKWSPVLNILSVSGEVADETPVSLVIVAHVTYRTSVLSRCLDFWRRRFVSLLDRQRWMHCLAEEWYSRRRLFLFFRAWQWRYGERRLSYTNAERAEQHWKSVGLQTSFGAWRKFVNQRKELNEKGKEMCGRNLCRVLLYRWLLWYRSARLKLSFYRVRSCYTASVISHRLRQWRLRVLELSLYKVQINALQVHIPLVLAGLAIQFRNAFYTLAARYYMIQWLRITSQRRGKRLQRYTEAVQRIAQRRNMCVTAHFYKRWALRTASTLHCRRTFHFTRFAFFHKWMRHHSRECMCNKMLRHTFIRSKQSALRRWTQRTAVRSLQHQRTAEANDFFCRVVRRRQSLDCFRQWNLRFVRRRAFCSLRQGAQERRAELLRDICASRLLQSVLFSFLKPAETVECSNAETQEEPRVTVVHRARPIPLGGRTVSHLRTDAQAQTARISVSTQHDAHTLFSPQTVRDVSPVRGVTVSCSSDSSCRSSSLTCVSFSSLSPTNAVAQGRGLLLAYSALRAAAAADADETRLVKERLRLCEKRNKNKNSHNNGALPTQSELAETEVQLRDRLLALQQRGVQREGLRAQVLQFTRHLEEMVQVKKRPKLHTSHGVEK